MKSTFCVRVIVCVMLLSAGITYSWSAYSQTKDEEAKLHFKQGVALFQEENYKMALAEFLRSYEIKPNWKLKLTIGKCYFNLKKFVAARKELLGYLEEGGDEVSEENKAEAEDLLLRMKNVIAEVKVETNVSGAKVFIDDKEIATTPMKQSYAIEAGLYELRIEAEGYKPYVKDINLAGGDKKFMDVSLVKKTGAPAKEVEEKIPGEKDEEKTGGKEKKGKKLSGMGIGAIALGVAALGAWGGVAGVGVKVRNLKKELDDCKKDPACNQKEENDLADDGNMFRNVLNFGMIPAACVLSAASVALGVVAAIKQKKEKESASRPHILNVGFAPPSGDPSGLMLSVTGQF